MYIINYRWGENDVLTVYTSTPYKLRPRRVSGYSVWRVAMPRHADELPTVLTIAGSDPSGGAGIEGLSIPR